jgi:thiol-disulfide isomerase/thioredoxin
MRVFMGLLVLVLLAPLWATAAPIKEGEAAPGFSLPSLTDQGRVIELQELRGRVVYVDFWASWCGPCRVSFPLLDDIRKELGGQGFEVLAINVDEFPEDALTFLEELPVSYLVVRDDTGSTPQAYGILGMPTGFLIDREGTVRKVHQGFRKSDGPRLRTEILELLEE